MLRNLSRCKLKKRLPAHTSWTNALAYMLTNRTTIPQSYYALHRQRTTHLCNTSRYLVNIKPNICNVKYISRSWGLNIRAFSKKYKKSHCIINKSVPFTISTPASPSNFAGCTLLSRLVLKFSAFLYFSSSNFKQKLVRCFESSFLKG